MRHLGAIISIVQQTKRFGRISITRIKKTHPQSIIARIREIIDKFLITIANGMGTHMDDIPRGIDVAKRTCIEVAA